MSDNLTDLSNSELEAFEWHGHSSGTETPMLIRDAIKRACAEIHRRRGDNNQDLAAGSFVDRIAPNESMERYLRETNTKTWLEYEAVKLGTPNQLERYTAGVLPQDELLSLAREELFKPLATFPRWKAIGYAAVNHRGDCRARIDIMSVPAKVCGDNALDHDTWENYKRFANAIGTVAESHPWMVKTKTRAVVGVYDHVAQCGKCGVEVRKQSIKVTIPWAGRNLVREFAL